MNIDAGMTGTKLPLNTSFIVFMHINLLSDVHLHESTIQFFTDINHSLQLLMSTYSYTT